MEAKKANRQAAWNETCNKVFAEFLGLLPCQGLLEAHWNQRDDSISQHSQIVPASCVESVRIRFACGK